MATPCLMHPCPQCNRHVHDTETTCPFCAAALDFSEAAPPVLTRRLTRAAQLALGAALAAEVMTGCSDDRSFPAYGGPPYYGYDASSSDAATEADAPGDAAVE